MQVTENEAAFLGISVLFGQSLLFIHTLFLMNPPPPSVRLSDQFKQEICPRLLGPHLHLLSGLQPQVATCPLTCHPRNSWCCHC